MKPGTSLLKRCGALEQTVRALRRPAEVAQARYDAWLASMTALSEVFPAERYEELLALVRGPAWPSSGLDHVRLLIERGFWKPMPIPLEVADVFLAEPDLEADARCERCAMVLSYRMGVSTNTAAGHSWQGGALLHEVVPVRRHHPALRPAAGPAAVGAGARRAAVGVLTGLTGEDRVPGASRALGRVRWRADRSCFLEYVQPEDVPAARRVV